MFLALLSNTAWVEQPWADSRKNCRPLPYSMRQEEMRGPEVRIRSRRRFFPNRQQPFSWNQHSLWGILLLNLWSFILWILHLVQQKFIYNTIIQALERQWDPSRSLLSGRKQTSKWCSQLWVKEKYKWWWRMGTRPTLLEMPQLWRCLSIIEMMYYDCIKY